MADPTRCLVCGSEALIYHFSAVDSLVSGETFRIMRCGDCGFIFTANPPDKERIGTYYLSDDYISHTDRKRNVTEALYHFARRFMLGRKAKLVTGVCRKKSGTLLDIGSGTGYFAAFMEEKGWKVKGVEISDMARNYSVSRFGIDAVPPDAVRNLADKSVDCITLWHVLEHFYDPDHWMKEIARILKDDGKCIMALPNINSADSKRFCNNWAALDVPRHLWHFGPETLNKFVQQRGFRCTMSKGMPLDLFYISIISYKNSRTRLAFIRGIATGTFLAIRNIFIRNSSSSLIYVIEKGHA
ncbi:MAG TPA: class I SAM-dependent methyltransferase [Bacteroidales bacterium]|nr:class I SAM-dependent methyltransferase [Bacteroidales bacterium]